MNNDKPIRTNQDIATGLIFMTTAMLVIPIIDAIAKHLSDSIPPVQVAWMRFVVGTAMMVPIAIWQNGIGTFKQPHLHWHFLRGAGIAGATAFFFAALVYMPLANVAAIFFVEPLILTVFSAVFLGERIGWRRILAVLIGFGGALLIIRPSFSELGAPALLPLGAAFCFAAYMAITKKLSNSTDPWTLQALANISGIITLGAVILAHSGTRSALAIPSPIEGLQVLIIGVVAIACHTLIIFALKRVSAAVIAPFQYLEIIGATFWGYVFFADFPDALTWLGITIIVGSGVFVFYRERQQGA